MNVNLNNRLPIFGFYLTSTEFMIAYLYDDTQENHIIVKNPVIVQLMQFGEEIKMVLRKWISYSDDQFYTIPKLNIMTQCSVNRDLENSFIFAVKKDEKTRKDLESLELSTTLENSIRSDIEKDFLSDEPKESKPKKTKSVKTNSKGQTIH